MKWISAGNPNCKHQGETNAYCRMCGYPLYQDEGLLEFLFR